MSACHLRPAFGIVVLCLLALGACTSTPPPLEQAAPGPMAQPAIPSQYRPEELVGRWGYGAFHKDSDLT